jgi:hypothetical protein
MARLVFQKIGEADDLSPALRDFLNSLSDLDQGVTICRFRSAHELREKVKEAVTGWQSDTIRNLARGSLNHIFQAPALPPHYVERKAQTTRLESNLRAKCQSAPGILVLDAIHGLAGIGKSTLVAAVAHRAETRSRFKDGVLWTTLGHEPDIMAALTAWIRALGDAVFQPITIDAASKHLRTLLQARTVLLVIDDAWQAAHVKPFIVASAGSSGCDYAKHRSCRGSEALQLFEGRIGYLLEGQDRRFAEQVAHSLGYLPLALEPAAATINRKTSWQQLLHEINTERGRLAAIGSPTSRLNPEKHPLGVFKS